MGWERESKGSIEEDGVACIVFLCVYSDGPPPEVRFKDVMGLAVKRGWPLGRLTERFGSGP